MEKGCSHGGDSGRDPAKSVQHVLKPKTKKLGNVAFWQSKYAKVFQLGEKYYKVLRITYFERKDHEKTTFSLPRRQILTSKQKYSNPPQVLMGHSPDVVGGTLEYFLGVIWSTLEYFLGVIWSTFEYFHRVLGNMHALNFV